LNASGNQNAMQKFVSACHVLIYQKHLIWIGFSLFRQSFAVSCSVIFSSVFIITEVLHGIKNLRLNLNPLFSADYKIN
jgi:hypothetical protein